MKRILSLTLALLMTILLFGAAGAATFAHAEEENPYVGLWEITGQQDGDTLTLYAEIGVRAYLDLLPSGAIYAVMVSGEDVSVVYMAYQATGENTLNIYEGEDPLPAVYDPVTGVITVTEPEGGLVSFVERVKDDPLPDIRALVDLSQEERHYYGYRMTTSGVPVDLLEVLPTMNMDPRDFYLTLNPDGTGHLQFGSEESGGDITWTETEFTAEGESISYTREGDHILFSVDEDNSIEFAPAGEVEALMAMLGIEGVEPAEAVDVDAEDLVGEWRLASANAMGQTLTHEQIEAQGLSMSFQFNEDGSAAMINKGETTDGLSWELDGSTILLKMYSYELFQFRFDGTNLILSMGANLIFEKVG